MTLLLKKDKALAEDMPLVSSPEELTEIVHDNLHEMVSEAAYYLAEKRGFEDGCPEDDWLTAEANIKAMLDNQV